MARIVGVIDIGSNSARIAIFKRTSRLGFYLLDEKKIRVRIAEGSYENGGMLQEAPMQRTLLALLEFKQIAKMHGARKLFCVATSAVRDAPNSAEFLKLVRKECGICIKIIDGEKEAYFGGLACANLLHQRSGISIDVGGGSSECALLEHGKTKELYSLNVGAIRIKELFFDGKNDIDGARAFIAEEFKKLPQSLKHSVALGIGGSIRALTKIILKESVENVLHGFEVVSKRYVEFCERICVSDPQALREMGFNEDRIETIRGGALVFAMILEHFGVEKVVTSGVGVREGVFLNDLLRGKSFPQNFNPSVRSLLDRFDTQHKRTKRITKEALRLFDALLVWHHCKEDMKRFVRLASSLSLVGEYLGCHSQSSHSAYLAFNGLEYGFCYQERLLIKTLIEFSNKKAPKESKITSLSLFELQALCLIVALAKVLSLNQAPLEYEFYEGKLWIVGASYLVREQIEKIAKSLKIEWGYPPKQKPLLKLSYVVCK